MTLSDCWNTIGIRGDSSCPELATHVHCQNCPTYASAAQTLLDREPPADYRAAATAHFAVPRVTQQRATESVVIFDVGAETLALPASVVSEIARPRKVHSLPHKRDHIQGVVNVHGELVVCVSLGRMLGLVEPDDATDKARRTASARILVVQGEGVRAVCPVDEVHGIHLIQPQQLQDAPATVSKSASTYTRKVLTWRDRAVGVLNDQLLFIALKRSFA